MKGAKMEWLSVFFSSIPFISTWIEKNKAKQLVKMLDEFWATSDSSLIPEIKKQTRSIYPQLLKIPDLNTMFGRVNNDPACNLTLLKWVADRYTDSKFDSIECLKKFDEFGLSTLIGQKYPVQNATKKFIDEIKLFYQLD